MNKPVPHLKARPYAYYILFILTVILIFNFVDRTIISILAQQIKHSLNVSDGSLGFLYGTAFAVIYSIFGMPLARLGDVWSRKKIIAGGLFFWSLMTTLSGFAGSFMELAIYRLGVGIGESSADPASLSMIADSFSKRMRATAFGIWSTGIYLGSGLGLMLGGGAIAAYHNLYPHGNAPLGLADWQYALLVVGLPGLLLTLVVLMLREPKRGQMDDMPAPEDMKHPFRFLLKELSVTIPPFTIIVLYKLGGDKKLVLRNIFYGLLLLTGSAFLTYAFGNPLQWYALSLGIYSFISWVQRLEVVDRPCYHIIFKGKALIYAVIGASLSAFNGYGIGFWYAPYLIRRFEVSEGEVGGVIGLLVLVTGFLGIGLGGLLSDIWKRKSPKARLYVILISTLGPLPFYIYSMISTDLYWVYVNVGIGIFIGTLAISSGLALVSELCPPRMRATSVAFYQLSVTVIGLALGPYFYGILSDVIGTYGYSEADRLQLAILTGLIVMSPIITALVIKSAWHVEEEENNVMQRSLEAGEVF